MKVKAILAAVVLASGAANAAVEDDLLFVVNDVNTGAAFVQDLNVNYDDIRVNGLAGSFDIDASFNSVFANSAASDLRWSLAVAGGDPLLQQDGLVTTGIDASATTNQLGVEQGVTKFNTLTAAVNIAQNDVADVYTNGGNVAIENAVDNWNNRISALVGWDNSASLDSSLNLYQLGYFNNEQCSFDPITFEQVCTGDKGTFINSMTATPWTFSADDLTVSAVPVPAAAWLMISALFGLGGIARRRKTA